jgi:hypothetical protein
VLLESARRRPGFVPTVAIELADRQTWWFPGPDPRPDDPDYQALVRSVLEAEDAPERSLAELALAILLLGCNYALSAAAFQELLIFAPGDPALLRVRAAFSVLAAAHAGSLPSGDVGGCSPRTPRRSVLALVACGLRDVRAALRRSWVRLPGRWARRASVSQPG